LEWLWGFYWGRVDAISGAVLGDGGLLDSSLSEEAGYDGEDALRRSLKGILEQAAVVIEGVQADGDEPPRKRRKKVQTRLEETAERVVSVLKGETEGSRVLAEVLLQDGILIPRGRR
jgi:hypothetical protein